MAPWSAVGISALVGMLAVDAMFDFGDAEAAKSYYCTLLPTLFTFPQCLRVLVPVLFSGNCILQNWFCHRSLFHVGSCVALILGGIPCFGFSIYAVDGMCRANMSPELAMPILQKAHAAMAIIF
eukprot:CAMPEP_0181463018 /NCGR_PEP_ID=MMETSP1110-20121109/34699_1 /TAXON_ID=174948 /ORGANISM="Symbiodinium sp., Strain CCMP421" /LENGTH=123 /DNA_ID=CAMNT_0023587705 /DNA_START=46 /DNA_END=414 /DNA_ORIENTATION=-